ncbi:uncharacterized protein LOC134335279 [Trichomycterus rosablanca]|uniref:uncharacterized protein LOC134335279 n=1 Tax=Trichomycterus rosablanca TaxID=2290929 RepID=UPI002F354789
MGSVQTAEWVPRSEPSDWRCRGGPAGSARPRAWSVRTFHDFLLPFPQLHRKWCSWNLTSPFSKLVDSSVSSGSVMDGGDHRNLLSGSSLIFCSLPQSHSARRQRRFNPSRFNSSSAASKHVSDPEGAPYGPEENVQICTDHEDVTVPVFGVSEDDDREPLVSAEQGNGVSTVDDAQVSEYFTHTGSVRSTSGVVDESKLDVLKTTSNAIHLPSLSHVTAACELVGKDM